MKRSIFKKLLVIVMVMSFVVAGCGSKKENSSSDEPKTADPTKKEAKSITVLVEGGSPAYAVAQQTADEFYEKTGIEVKIDAVPYVGVYDKLRAEVSAGTGAYDVATIDILWFPALQSGLESLDDLYTSEVREDIMPSLIDGATLEGKIYGMPTWTNCKTMLYRTDLFEDEAEKAAFKEQYGYDLKVPETWEEYRDVAKFFTRDTDGDGAIDLYGASVFGMNNGDSVASWLDFAMQAGADPLILDGDQVNVNDAPYVEAMQLLVDLLKTDESAPAGALEMASAEYAELFYSGKLAVYLAWGHFYVPANNPELSDVAGKVGTAPNLMGEAGVGALPGPWYQVMPKSSKNKEAAKQYMAFLYEKNNLYMDALGVAARTSVLEEYQAKDGYEHLASLQTTLNGDATLNRPAIVEWNQIESEALVPALQMALSGDKTPQEACDWAKETIENIMN